MNADESKAKRIEASFHKGSFSTPRSGPWSGLATAVHALAKNFRPDEGELHVIFSADSEDSWTLLTSRRLVWQLNGEIRWLPYEDLEEVNPRIRDWMERKQAATEWGAPLYTGATRLEVQAKRGARWKIPLEGGGGPLGGLILALTAMVRAHQKRRATILTSESRDSKP